MRLAIYTTPERSYLGLQTKKENIIPKAMPIQDINNLQRALATYVHHGGNFLDLEYKAEQTPLSKLDRSYLTYCEAAFKEAALIAEEEAAHIISAASIRAEEVYNKVILGEFKRLLGKQ